MDRITHNLLFEFVADQDLTHLPESEQFEHFVNNAVISTEYQESFDVEDVYVGGDGNPGIDGLAIIVNGSLVTDVDEVDDLIETNKYLEVAFVFVQAKTSSKFEGADIGSFIEAVRDFFREKPRLVRGSSLEQRARISDHIFQNTGKLRSNPTCALFYVTTGSWTGDKNLQGRIEQGTQDLERTDMFSRVLVTACGAKELQKLHRQSKETLAIEIDFPNKVTLPEIPEVKQAFIGVVSVATLFKLIIDDAGILRRSVFEDNIRDFQGSTEVNAAIRKTLNTSDQSKSFVVLNNGITVVCRELQQTGNKCTLVGYQIVNGCQTSNVLYGCRNDFDHESVLVPIKLIGTENEEIVAAIISATNSQNAVKPEELEAMTDFQKQLESYYKTFSGAGTLYYERRSKQWVSAPIEKTRVTTIPGQIKSLASMFLNLPHRVSGYYGTVRRRLGETIFRPDHKLIPYYTSALGLYRLDSLFRSRMLDPKLKSLRWYLLMLFRESLAGPAPQLSSNAIESYCKKLIEILMDPSKSEAAYMEVVRKVSVGGLPEFNGDSLKTQDLRDRLLSKVR